MLRQTICLLLSGLCAAAGAHEGHDHAEQPPALSNPLAARFYGGSDKLELVAIHQGTHWQLYLDHHDNNQPLRQARVSLEANGKTGIARANGDHYLLDAPWLSQPGRHLLVLSVESPLLNELLSVEYTHHADAADTHANEPHPPWPASRRAAAGGLLAGLLLAAFWFWRKQGQRRASA